MNVENLEIVDSDVYALKSTRTTLQNFRVCIKNVIYAILRVHKKHRHVNKMHFTFTYLNMFYLENN